MKENIIHGRRFQSIGTYNTHGEKKSSQDEEVKNLVRARRKPANLPDGYTKTKWIKKPYQKSWKVWSKKRRQYEKHIKTEDERRIKKDFSTKFHDLYYKYAQGKFHVIPRESGFKSLVSFSFNSEYMEAIQELVRLGMAEIIYGTTQRKFWLYGMNNEKVEKTEEIKIPIKFILFVDK